MKKNRIEDLINHNKEEIVENKNEIKRKDKDNQRIKQKVNKITKTIEGGLKDIKYEVNNL
jgi:uncharacterized FlaG/YvyC family protein